MKILIVDDQKVNRLLLKKILEKTGSELLCAENGLEAINIFQQSKPDLILMDMVMPVMDGLEAIQKIRGIKAEKMCKLLLLARCQMKSVL
jgi:CheY-like chemotaxis protein